MSQGELFVRLIVTALLAIAAVVQLRMKHYAMGVFLICIPMAGWLSLWLGK